MNFAPGDSIGARFDVLNKLGEGGAGIVYLVRDRQRNEEVALKVIRSEIANSSIAAERFKLEAKTMTLIDHSSMVKVYDRGKLNDQLFFTMEYVQGDTISRIVRKTGPISIEKAISIMREVCAGIELVHKVAIHRDISSDNIILKQDNSVRILDFGTARVTGDDATKLTRVGMHVGKMYYSAPEQRADASSVDHRADLYSLGVLLYEMITGKLVIGYEPVTKHRPELAPDWDVFFRKALATAPTDRFDSAAEFAAAMNRLPYHSAS